ncbi:unnamed protein product [Coregonus sp. 'balchen']|nr:unnamed protein product [Coregonus sp. 'balchen']
MALLCSKDSSPRNHTKVLMNTKTETSDLRWTIYSHDNPQWEEVSGLDEENNSVRTYQICQMDGASSHWLRSGLIQRRGASQVYVELRFTVIECSSRVDTVAADFLLRKGGERKFNVKTLRLGPLSKRGFYLAFQAQGACMALLSVRVFFKKCPALASSLSSFPETVPRTLVQEAQGVCVDNAAQQGPRPRPPKLFCGEDGQWVGQPTTSCGCLPGYEPADGHTRCSACSVGQFRSGSGGQCQACPGFSHAVVTGSPVCQCRPGYLRANSDTPDTPCTRPPSAPRSIVTQINDTTVTLEWSEPMDSGGRTDLSYSVECSLCGTPRGPCSPCGDNVSYRPSQRGLLGRRVVVWGLMPHTTYTFSIQALNGVSPSNGKGAPSDRVNITTSHEVPVLVSVIRKSISTESSLTLHWSVPAQPHYTILQYQLRYWDDSPNQLLMTSFLIAMGMLLLITVVTVAVLCIRRHSRMKDPELSDKHGQYLLGQGVKVYIDPFTYEDPNEAVREFAKEIDVSFVKIEEVIGAEPQSSFQYFIPRIQSCLSESQPSHPLLDQRAPPAPSACGSVGEWLRAIKMERYEDSFLQAGFTSVDLLAQITAEKILSSIQTLTMTKSPVTIRF